jgi:hypothetical protein
MRAEMTIMLRDEDREQLARLGDELNLTAREMAERILRRALNKTPGRSAPSNSERAADRALRQVELTKLLRRRRLSTLGQADKRRLAQRFGVTERTIYRDLTRKMSSLHTGRDGSDRAGLHLARSVPREQENGSRGTAGSLSDPGREDAGHD